MNFKSLVERRRLGVGSAPSLLQRIRGSSSGAVTAQRGTGDGHTDTAGLGGRSLAPESGWGTHRGTVAREMTVLAVVAKVTGATPGQGMVGAGGDTYPLSPQSVLGTQGGVGHSPPAACSHLCVLQMAGVITAPHGSLGLVWVQLLELKPIFGGGWNVGGTCLVLQEGGTPVSAWAG